MCAGAPSAPSGPWRGASRAGWADACWRQVSRGPREGWCARCACPRGASPWRFGELGGAAISTLPPALGCDPRECVSDCTPKETVFGVGPRRRDSALLDSARSRNPTPGHPDYVLASQQTQGVGDSRRGITKVVFRAQLDCFRLFCSPVEEGPPHTHTPQILPGERPFPYAFASPRDHGQNGLHRCVQFPTPLESRSCPSATQLYGL